jgi:hypothetical protein
VRFSSSAGSSHRGGSWLGGWVLNAGARRSERGHSSPPGRRLSPRPAWHSSSRPCDHCARTVFTSPGTSRDDPSARHRPTGPAPARVCRVVRDGMPVRWSRWRRICLTLRLKERLGDRLHARIVLGMAPAPFQYAERIWGLPAAFLWAWRHA